MEHRFGVLVVRMLFLYVVSAQMGPSQSYYYYEPSQTGLGYYSDIDDSGSVFHTMGIPHTKDNSMRALADIITPKQTQQDFTTASTIDTLDDVNYGYYYNHERPEPGLNISKSQPYYDWGDYYDDYYDETSSNGRDYDYEQVIPTDRPVSTEEGRNNAQTTLPSTTEGSNQTNETSGSTKPLESSTEPTFVVNTTISLITTVSSYIPNQQTTVKTTNVTVPGSRSTEHVTISIYNTTENLHRPTRSSTDSLGLDYGEVAECDLETQAGCDVIHFERCDAQSRKCSCLNGYVRDLDGKGQCQAANYYHGHVTLKVGNIDRKHYEQKINAIRIQLLQTIRQLFRKRSDISLLDLGINSFETRGGELTISFDISMAKGSLPETEGVDSLWENIVLLSSAGDLHPLMAFNITANGQEKGFNLFSPLVEINQCARQAYHYCSQMAQCLYDSPKVACRCQPGFEDAATDLHRLPGEVCVEKCTCKNGGLCLEIDEARGTKQCSCLPWYLGTECEIDGKELLVICVCCLGLLIVLGLGLCCCCHARAKHKESVAKSRMFHFTPEPNILKLPRVWMDTPCFHDDLSPQNARRMSMASGADVNEYFGGFILEDLSGTNIQRHADALNSYYQTTANLCGVPSSSQQSLFRY